MYIIDFVPVGTPLSLSVNHHCLHSIYTGKVKVVVKYSPKVLEEMEQRFEHSKSFRRGRSSRK